MSETILDHPAPSTHVVPSPSDWRKYITIHPACDCLPLLSKDELQELADDIKLRGGLLYKLRVSSSTGALLDGRNRLDALALLGWRLVDPATGTWDPDFERKYILKIAADDERSIIRDVVSSNLRRRHLTPEQRIDLALKLLTTTNAIEAPSTGEPSPIEQRAVGAGEGPGQLRGSKPSVVGTITAMTGHDRKTVRTHLRRKGVLKPKSPSPAKAGEPRINPATLKCSVADAESPVTPSLEQAWKTRVKGLGIGQSAEQELGRLFEQVLAISRHRQGGPAEARRATPPACRPHQHQGVTRWVKHVAASSPDRRLTRWRRTGTRCKSSWAPGRRA